MAYLKTHYYGGIRKYQWVATPLELHGKVMRRDGSEVYVKIGATSMTRSSSSATFCRTLVRSRAQNR